MTRGDWTAVFPHQLSWVIDNPLRRLIISPQTLAERLALSDSSRILELGPGPGYFSTALAARVPKGRLELFDLQPEMLAKARRKLERRGFRNVGYTVGNAGDELPYPDGHFDVAVLVSVLGEVPDRSRCLKSLHRVLRPAGMLVLHESLPDPDMIRFDVLRGLVEAQAFKLHRRRGRPWNYTAAFVRSEPADAQGAG